MRMLVSADRLGARLLAALMLLPLSGCSSGPPSCEQTATSGAVVSCSGGWEHRASPAACTTPPTPSKKECSQDPALGDAYVCKVDADCTAGPYGRCNLSGSESYGFWCGCEYGCITDSDCDSGSICTCGEAGGGYCEQSSCRTDAECGDGLLCASLPGTSCDDETAAGSPVYTCQSPDDECMSDLDCPGGYCDVDRRCQSGDPCEGIGRPFLVDGSARTAPLLARGDWRARGLSPDMAGLDAEARTALATRWALMGAMEHASVAAFARFVLQLLSLGAPADLVRDAQAAMADETRHAELCYALASAYAETPLGPGSLDVDRALDSNRVREILITTIHEGCVGETVAALEAAETAARAEDPVVRAVLGQIAVEESRHAELAYRFVRWVLAAHPELAGAARAAFDEALAGPARGELVKENEREDDEEALAAHGFAGDALRREVRRRALARAVAPCARALFARVDMAA